MAAGPLEAVSNRSAGYTERTGASRYWFRFADRGTRPATPAGRAMADLLAIFAEFERETLRERTRAGLANARQDGNGSVGRLPLPYTLQIGRLRNDGINASNPPGSRQFL